jgi:Dihydroxyacid dehydratase/phosphogluconate dehydratase
MRSDKIKKGFNGAHVRQLFYGMGYTEEEIDRPWIGVVNSHNEIVPGHMLLDRIADAAKRGVSMGGGTPIEVPAIGICDGIAMGHEGMRFSLASRELIADSIEAVTIAHQFDGLVLIPNCDKIIPGMVMAAARLDMPAVVVSGGPMRAGDY